MQRLLCVQPGISAVEVLQQSSCVILRKGRFYTLSQEIACSIKSGLDDTLDGAVHARKFIEILQKLPDDELDLAVEDGILKVRGERKRLELPLESEVVLPVSEVEVPKEWQKLNPDFCQAVSLVVGCTQKGVKADFIKQCVHVHPQWLEASDNVQMMRYLVNTPVSKSVLVRGETIKTIVQLGMTHGAETENWLHFYSPMKLRLSVRKFGLEKYPPLEKFLELRGRRVTLPRGLEKVTERAAVFRDETDNVLVALKDDTLTMRGVADDGVYHEECSLKYSGQPISFVINHKLVGETLKKSENWELTDVSIRVDGGKYVYVSSLEKR